MIFNDSDEYNFGNNQISYGANSRKLCLAGLSVKDARGSCGWKIDEDTEVYINGKIVDLDKVINQNDRIEFMKNLGVKG